MRATLKLASLAGRIGSLSYLLDLAQQDLAELLEMPEAMDAIDSELEMMRLIVADMDASLLNLAYERTRASDIIRGVGQSQDRQSAD